MTSLSTSCVFHLPLRPALRLARETGYDGIELVLGPEAWLLGPERTRALAERHGLSILTIHQSLMPLTPAGPGDARMLDAARFADQIDCPTVVIHGPWAEAWFWESSQRWLHVLERCQKALAFSETRLALENVGVYDSEDQATLLAANEELLAFCRDRDLDITLDTCHVGTQSPDLIDTWRHLGERVANVHFSDIRHGRFALNDWLRSIDSHHQLPGEGELPLAAFCHELAACGYDGPITVEVSPAALQAWSPRRLRDNLRHARRFIEQALACAV